MFPVPDSGVPLRRQPALNLVEVTARGPIALTKIYVS